MSIFNHNISNRKYHSKSVCGKINKLTENEILEMFSHCADGLLYLYITLKHTINIPFVN